MTHHFLDSSALFKRYLPEQGTLWIRSLTSPSAFNRVILAQITPVEAISRISRRNREGHLSPEHARAVRLLLERHVRDQYAIIALTYHIVSRSWDLLEKLSPAGLRRFATCLCNGEQHSAHCRWA